VLIVTEKKPDVRRAILSGNAAKLFGAGVARPL